MSNFQEKVSFIWDLADLLRGSYKRNEYQKVILPFTVLKRFDSLLEHSKENVLKEYNKYKEILNNYDEALKPIAVDENGNPLGFYNYSKYDFKSLLADPEHLEENLIHYIDSFSSDVQDIFENFYIKNQITRLSKADLLFLLIQKFSETKVDLNPKVVSNHEMGMIFEELIRKFSEQSNEEAGEHFTPRDVVNLMTELMFVENGYHLKKENLIKTIYDPACGTGGMLTSCEEYIKERNDSIKVALYGQEVNEEIYAICKADMLMKGDKAHIEGPSSTLSNDQFLNDRFHYMISNPPYGRKWESDKDVVLKEAETGFDGRFGAGTPRINDGQLLFLEHMISKMKTKEKSRIAVITNGSPLFTGDAGSGESNIRKWIIENDYLETIIALPNQLFYNTEIKTYIWTLTNKKPKERIGKIQLIDASAEFKKVKTGTRKIHEITDENICNILNFFRTLQNNDNVRIFDNEDFGYTKVTIERPLQRNYQVSDERIEKLYSIPSFSKLATSKDKDLEKKIKEEEKGKKEQENIIDSLKKIPNKIMSNWDEFDNFVSDELGSFNLTPTFKKNIILALSEHDENAEYVKDDEGKIKADPNLKDTEKIPLKKDIDEYFKEEVQKYYSDAWIDREKDKIGFNLDFYKYFYKHSPPSYLNNDLSKIKLKYLCSSLKLLKNKPKCENSIIIPIFPKSKVFPSLLISEKGIKSTTKFIECVLDNDKILPHFLIIFLNSEMGIKQREDFSNGFIIQKNSIENIKNIFIPIPSIEIQKKIIKTEKELHLILNKFKFIENTFDSDIFSYSEVLDLVSAVEENTNFSEKILKNLVWPLANAYLLATMSNTENVEKLDSYLNFFEFLIKFNSIVLLSALPKSIYKDEYGKIWGNIENFKMPSFGIWLSLYRNLSKVYKEISKNSKMDGENLEEEFFPLGIDFYKKISIDKKMNTFMGEIVKIRNKKAHDGPITAREASDIIDKIDGDMDIIWKIFYSYNSLQLVFTAEAGIIYDDEHFIYKMIDLNSRNISPPIYREIKTTKRLEKGNLYLYDKNSNEFLKFNKKFFYFKQCEKCSQWSVYIYSKFKDKSTYISNQQTEKHVDYNENLKYEDLIN